MLKTDDEKRNRGKKRHHVGRKEGHKSRKPSEKYKTVMTKLAVSYKRKKELKRDGEVINTNLRVWTPDEGRSEEGS